MTLSIHSGLSDFLDEQHPSLASRSIHFFASQDRTLIVVTDTDTGSWAGS